MKQFEIAGVCFIIILITVGGIFYAMPKISQEISTGTTAVMDSEENLLCELDSTSLCAQLPELRRIEQSVLRRLRELEKKIALSLKDLDDQNKQIDEFKLEIIRLNSTKQELMTSIKHSKIEQAELKHRHMPKVDQPIRLADQNFDRDHHTSPPGTFTKSCSMDKCFDYSRCSLFWDFALFVDDRFVSACSQKQMATFGSALQSSPYRTSDPDKACLFVLPVCSKSDVTKLSESKNWKGDGRNHLVVLLENGLVDANVDFGLAMLAAEELHYFRQDFDIPAVLDETLGMSSGIESLPPQVPARRKTFIYFNAFFNIPARTLLSEDEVLIRAMNTSSLSDDSALKFSCLESPHTNTRSCRASSWCYCEPPEPAFGRSTFSLVLSSSDFDSQAVKYALLGLKTGAIPVILGPLRFPFAENIDWKKSVIHLPKARAPEILVLLRTIRDEDIFRYRSNGRRIWETYFSSPAAVVNAILDTTRFRLNIPARSIPSVKLTDMFNSTYQPIWQTAVHTDLEENVGPVEGPLASDAYQRNFSSTALDRYEAWNVHFDAHALYPYRPFVLDMPGGAKFTGSEFGFRPIGDGAGGSGTEFSEALGGNSPREQFTVVILTYQREAILSATLGRLNNLAHLNKVVVVWNSPLDPSDSLTLPKIHVPIHIHKAEVNSLNNRFLPFDVIETEAVLSMDDDIQLRHDEINFAFRVWRENRERIVGFPARYHAWDGKYGSWLYNSNYTCELSMILTGAAFFHKYYMYQYTYTMPAQVRAKVDEFMNCEDIAMNFLVAHMTRKPPIKVTSRWTFRCPDCPISLWEDDSHFAERHLCIQHLEKVYGYMPLLNTQFRADSVLFKTRIPADKQKCYKII